MAMHKLVFLRGPDFEDECFIQLLGFAKVGSNPCLFACALSLKKIHLFFNSKIHPKKMLKSMANIAQYTCTRQPTRMKRQID
jgi:hypothetical protein